MNSPTAAWSGCWASAFKPVLFEFPTYEYFVTGEKVGNCGRMHLSMSYWAFVLMGLHLGMHIPAMTAGLKLKDRTKAILRCIFTCIGGIGLWLFLRNDMPNYLFFRVPFAFLDYEKAGWLVFFEK